MDEKTAVENAVDNTPEVAPEAPEQEDPLVIGDTTFTVIAKTVKNKKKGSERVVYMLKPAPDSWTMFGNLRKAVGPENFDKVLYSEVIRPCCNDSTLEAIKKSEDGKVSDVGLAKAIQEWFLPTTRRSGEHIKDLREKAVSIYNEMNPLLMTHFSHPPTDKTGKPTNDPESLKEEDYNRMLQLTLEYSELQKKIEDKTRKGKQPAATTK